MSSSLDGGGAGGDGGDGDDGSLTSRFASFVGGDSFRTMPKINIRVVDLLTAVVGGILLAAFEAVIRLVQLPFRLAAAVYDALSSFLADGIRAVFGASGAIELAFASARADVIGAGIAGLVVAVAAAGGAVIVAGWVIDRVRE